MQLTQTQIADMNHRDLSAVDGAILHHSVFYKTADISEIAAMEVKSQGFITVGYHAYCKCVDVEKDLWVVQIGRPIDCVPAAAYGYNTRSIDICIGGNYQPNIPGVPTDAVSENALKVAADWVLEARTKCPNLTFFDGHRDVEKWLTILKEENYTATDVATACPGQLLYDRLGDLRTMTSLKQRPQE